MFLTKYYVLRSNLLRKLITKNTPVSGISFRSQEFCRLTEASNLYDEILTKHQCQTPCHNLVPVCLLHRKWYSKELPDTSQCIDLDLKKIKAIFPEPRMTLNNLSAKTPDKVFEVHYKQYVAPKGVKKKAPQRHDWTCTYSFVWPEKMKFECTALSKRQAGEQAAIQALNWLTINKSIDTNGHPIYDKNTLNDIRSSLNQPIRATISEGSLDRIDNIWEDYEQGIRDIYERTAKQAQHLVINAPGGLNKDSTIDEEEFSEDGNSNAEELMRRLSDPNTPVHPIYGRVLRPPSLHALSRRSQALKQTFQCYDESIAALPIDEYANEITSTLQNSRVTVIVGAAGCGKSTRVPAMILRECGVAAAILVSEPRRVAAIGLANRVAGELGEEVGQSIGYQVRLNSKPPKPPAGSVLFCTSGVLLNRLQTNPGLVGCSHVVIDEAHERDVNTDISLLLLKRALDVNPELKIVIMSATLDTEVFTSYFGSCPVVQVPGRTFPVQISYLEDIERTFNIQLTNTMANSKREGKPQLNVLEIVETIKAVDRHGIEGAILVFLPGWADIKHAKQLLDECYGQSGIHIILPVHSRLSTDDQSRMFGIPPPGIRKIVLATNVAETSVTIPDVVHVIDTGAKKENTIREKTGTTSLDTVWVSLAGANQRSGRAGRVQPGHCYRLFTKEKETEFEPHTSPEILRVPLEQTVLDCKSYAPGDKAQDFLSELPDPPTRKAIQFAVNDLIDIGALTPNEELTRLGKWLSTLQVSPRVGLSLVHSCVVGTALATHNVVAHTDVEVFLHASDRRDEIREIKRKFSSTSDHAALNRIQLAFEEKLRSSDARAVDTWCQNHQLRKDRLMFVRSLSNLYLGQVLKTGLIDPNVELEEMNRFSGIDEVYAATLLSGTNGLLVTRRCVRTKGKLRTINEVFTTTGDRAHISSESVNKMAGKCPNGVLSYTGGRHSASRLAVLVHDTSALSAVTALLFTRGDVYKRVNDDDENTTVLTLRKHRLDISVPTSQAEALLKAREMLWKTIQYYIDRDLKTVSYEEIVTVNKFKVKLVKAIAKILVDRERDCSGERDLFEEIR